MVGFLKKKIDVTIALPTVWSNNGLTLDRRLMCRYQQVYLFHNVVMTIVQIMLLLEAKQQTDAKLATNRRKLIY